jgi:hypothetical protein
MFEYCTRNFVEIGNFQNTTFFKLHEYVWMSPYLLIPWSTFLLEKPTGFQLVKKFPSFYGTRRFITAFTSCPPPVPILSHLDPVHNPHPTSWRSILILSCHLRLGLPSGLLPSSYPNSSLYTPLISPHTRYTSRPSLECRHLRFNPSLKFQPSSVHSVTKKRTQPCGGRSTKFMLFHYVMSSFATEDQSLNTGICHQMTCVVLCEFMLTPFRYECFTR